MADILIKGLEGLKIPKEKRLVLAIEPDGEVWFPFEYKISRTFTVSASGAKTTTAIELPKHGDLISKKALEVQIAHAFHGNMFPDISAGLALNKVMNTITDAPVIVEASNGSDS